MKKKVWMLFLSCMLVAVLFVSGCSKEAGSDANSDGKVELVMWDLFGGGDGEYMKEMITEFNKSHPDIQVKNITLEWGDYYTKLTTATAAGKGPDIAVSHVTKLPELVNQGLAYELDELAEPAGVDWSTFNQNILSATEFDGKHYAIPIDTHAQVFFYNKKHLKEAGLLDDQGKPIIEETPEGFVKFMTTLKEKLPKDVAPLATATAGSDPFWMWWALYHQMGGNDVVSDDVKSVNIDTEKALSAATYVQDLFHESKVIPLNLEDFYQNFQTGKAATMVTGVWGTGIMEKQKDLDFGVIPFPQLYDQKAAWADSHSIFLPVPKKDDPKKLEAALKFANFLADNGQVWAKAGHVPSKTAVLDSEEFKELPYRSDYAEVAKYVVFPKQSDKTWPIRDILVKNLDTVWSGSKTPEEAFTKIEREIQGLLK